MARPRVFVSSTFYDLKYIRGTLEQFIIQMGYEPALFEKGDITFPHDRSVEESCIQEVGLCDILILIVGGRYGSLSQQALKADHTVGEQASDADAVMRVKSITRKEYEQAKKRDIPIFTFVEVGVLSELKTYQKNKNTKGMQFAHVDDKRVFELIEDIMAERRNNFVREFASADDIVSWLRDQWSGLFAEMLRQKAAVRRLSELEDQISELSQVVKSLKSYSEVIMRNVASGSADAIIKEENKKRFDEFLERLGQKYILPDFFRSQYKLDMSTQEINKAVVESADMRALLNKILTANQREDFFRMYSDEDSGGPWFEYKNIKQEYASFVKSLEN